MIVHLREADLRSQALQPWHYRCEFNLLLCFQKVNPDIGPGETDFVDQDLTGATLRFVVKADRDELPTVVPLYDLEAIEGGIADSHISWDADPLTGEVTVSWDEDDADAPARRNYWYHAILKIPGEKRKVRAEGFIDILPANDTTDAVDSDV